MLKIIWSESLHLQEWNDIYKYKIYPHYGKLFQNAQKDGCKNNAIGQFDRYGREGVNECSKISGGVSLSIWYSYSSSWKNTWPNIAHRWINYLFSKGRYRNRRNHPILSNCHRSTTVNEEIHWLKWMGGGLHHIKLPNNEAVHRTAVFENNSSSEMLIIL